MYRLTRKDDGHYVACDNYGNGIGDNIALVQEIEPGSSFPDAVFRLSGSPTVRPQQQLTEQKHDRPKLPEQTQRSESEGRQYLHRRGIDDGVINRAEKQGFLRYCNGAVLFVGSDSTGGVRNVTRRASGSADEVQKRDLRGTDKRFPQVLSGTSKTVLVVEGGADALAAHCISARKGSELPTVIVTGGSGVLGWADNENVRELLRAAERVVLVGENEKDQEAQSKADAQHRQQLELIRRDVPEVVYWKPKVEAGKDLAEVNLSEHLKELQADEIKLGRRINNDMSLG